MNIDDALRKIAAENNFTRLDVGIVTGHDGETYFSATAWGDGIGFHGCTSTVSYTHLTLPTKPMMCRSRWSPYH